MIPMRTKAPLLRALALTLCVGIGPLAPAMARATPTANQSAGRVQPREYAEFLKEKFAITFKATVTGEDFMAALATATGGELGAAAAGPKPGVPFDAMGALSIALKAANMQELADTYPAAKADRVLAHAKLHAAGLDAQARRELAAAVDTGLLAPSLFAGFKPQAAADPDLADSLLGGVLSMRGLYKHYLGTVGEFGLDGKFVDAFNHSVIIKAPELRDVVDQALRQKLITGYNLKDSRYDPHFIDSRTLTYGHSDLSHALQLLGLLRSEGMDAKVQFEPKTSAFVYLKEWGEPDKPSEAIEVRRIESGDSIEYAKEYDIAFEFNTVADKDRFQTLIATYAKVDKKGQPGLLIHSWWQPLFHSRTPQESYRLITNNWFSSGPYYAQSFSQNEKSAEIVAGLKAIKPGLDIKSYPFWVDEPFFRYLLGEAK